MKPTYELVSKPVSSSPRDEPQGMGIAQLVEGLADTLIEAGPVVHQLLAQSAQRCQQQLQMQQRIEAETAKIREAALQFAQRTAAEEQILKSITCDLAKCAGQNAHLIKRLETLEFNLEQVRLLASTCVEKQQHLVDDFIKRRVTDHLFKEFHNIQFTLARYSANGNPNLKADIQATADAIESFLIESGLQIINPSAGDTFEPREHQPIMVLPVGEADSDGTIAETITPGLRRSHRVIQLARVAVFKSEGEKSAS